jgi:hypothetical protein
MERSGRNIAARTSRMTDATSEAPLLVAPGYLLEGGLKNKPGTLLLFPDRLVHVATSPLAAVMYTGLLGYLIGTRLARPAALRRAAAGGKGVTEINLFKVTRVEKGTQGLNKNILVVNADGGPLRFGVKFDKWSDDIARAMHALGRKIIGDAEGFSAE